MKIINFIHSIKNDLKKQSTEYRPLPETAFLTIADLHYINEDEWDTLETLSYSEYSAVLFLGDILPTDMRHILSMIPEGIPCLYVLGNHDKWEQFKGSDRLIDLDGKLYTTKEGITIGGLSASPRYKDDPSWAMRTEEEATQAIRDLGPADILISHESPYHMLGTNRVHCGYQAITDYIREYKPSLHLFGHHHFPHEEMLDGTKCICIFRCAEINTGTGETRTVF